MKPKGALTIRLLGEFLCSLTPEQVEGLERGELEVVVVPRRKRSNSESRRSPAVLERIEQVLAALNAAADRETGYSILSREAPTKSDLEAITRAADLPFNQSDRVHELQERIVEATIGYRLRSRAIQATDD